MEYPWYVYTAIISIPLWISGGGIFTFVRYKAWRSWRMTFASLLMVLMGILLTLSFLLPSSDMVWLFLGGFLALSTILFLSFVYDEILDAIFRKHNGSSNTKSIRDLDPNSPSLRALNYYIHGYLNTHNWILARKRIWGFLWKKHRFNPDAAVSVEEKQEMLEKALFNFDQYHRLQPDDKESYDDAKVAYSEWANANALLDTKADAELVKWARDEKRGLPNVATKEDIERILEELHKRREYSEQNRLVSNPDGLSSREMDVLKLVAVGKTNEDVAAILFITKDTVNTHIKHIREKANLPPRDTRALITYAYRIGLGNQPEGQGM